MACDLVVVGWLKSLKVGLVDLGRGHLRSLVGVGYCALWRSQLCVGLSELRTVGGLGEVLDVSRGSGSASALVGGGRIDSGTISMLQ